MAKKDADKHVTEWFWKLSNGSKKGPSDIRIIREKVLAGEITAQTEVSQDGKSWSPAVFASDFGFDCIVLQVGESLNVLGPFAREYMDQQEAESEIPADGILFLRGGLVSEALPRSDAVGETGAALVEKVMAAERRLRETLKEKRVAETALAAKDLEFDAERQRLNSTISTLKAEAMKLESELEGLRAEALLSDADKRRQSALEAKLVDTENACVQASKEALQLKESAAASARQVQELIEAVSCAEANVRDVETKRTELEGRLVETGKQLSKHQARCVELEGELASKGDSEAQWEHRVSELEAQVAKLNNKLQTAEDNQAASHALAAYLRDNLIDLAKQAEAQFAALSGSAQAGPKSRNDLEAIEEVEAEIIEDSSPANSMKVRSTESRSDGPQNVKLSAIENQLKREISTLGASKSAPSLSGHDGFINVFKRRK